MKKNIIIILTILSVLTFNSFSHDGENHSSEHRLKLDYKLLLEQSILTEKL